jgi:hypothetical protein
VRRSHENEIELVPPLTVFSQMLLPLICCLSFFGHLVHCLMSPCEYCKYCIHCQSCVDCPCQTSPEKPFCDYCKYCRYCSACSLCNTICTKGSVFDYLRSSLETLTQNFASLLGFSNDSLQDLPNPKIVDQQIAQEKIRQTQKNQ